MNNQSPQYFILEHLEPEDPESPETASFSYDRDYIDRSWYRGKRFEVPPPEPVLATTEGGILPDLSEVPLPLMSQRLTEALKAAGVTNIDYYPALLRNEITGETFDTYLAFNLVGLVAAADLFSSDYEAPEGPLVSVDFDSLVIAQEKARGALMFRLAECVTAIVVHETVKRAIESTDINTLKFVPPDEWVG